MSIRQFALIAVLMMFHAAGHAGEADVLAVDVERTGSGIYRFSVTVRHADTGWEHYAYRFEVLSPGGEVLGTRILYHPHVNEQPFTRSLSGVYIPAGITSVTVRAGDSVHGVGGAVKTVPLP